MSHEEALVESGGFKCEPSMFLIWVGFAVAARWIG
jgi:hypothetical protein